MRFDVLLGKTLTAINGAKKDSSCIWFHTMDGEVYEMSHTQSCCEGVEVEDICGDLDALIGYPIVQAEESSDTNDSGTESWTFYKISTIKGSVTIRWIGRSNSEYAMEVDFALLGKPYES